MPFPLKSALTIKSQAQCALKIFCSSLTSPGTNPNLPTTSSLETANNEDGKEVPDLPLNSQY